MTYTTASLVYVSLLGLAKDTDHKEKTKVRLLAEFSMGMMLTKEQYSVQGCNFYIMISVLLRRESKRNNSF
jgi:hypothetical protein